MNKDDTFLDEELFPVVKPITEISSEDIESIWLKYLSRLRSKLIVFLIGVTTFLAFFKKSIEQSNGKSEAVFLIK